jgi:radical SAM superfamily enzyme with C-terminal helix-hairpin-helix motif
MTKYLILDCYVDEPACFGVPPFISPYPRYIYGALICAGVDPENITYKTIDDIRPLYVIQDSSDTVFLIGGAVVPGKYLGYKIGRIEEIIKIAETNKKKKFIVGGLAGRLAKEKCGSNILSLSGDIEFYAYTLAKGCPEDGLRSNESISRWAFEGVSAVRSHFEFPHIIAEIETYRGCPRKNHCSFCSESIFKDIEFRPVDDILKEIDALISQGVSRFRIGRQADILAYGSELSEYRKGFPKPGSDPLFELFTELKKRKEEGKIQTLNIDNANPGTIANFPDESSLAIDYIVKALTPGDTMPMGIESFDPEVKARNNLKVSSEEAFFAAKIINDIGGVRVNGVPVLLPGINLIHGLSGESAETFRINYEELFRMKDAGILIKRINIRSLLPFPGTKAERENILSNKKINNRYEFYRDKIRNDIDHYMLSKIYPVGTTLEKIRVVETMFDYSLARPLQSYAITVKLPTPLKKGTFIDAIVVAHRERSLIALPNPIQINFLPAKALEFLPGVGKRAAGDIVLKRPLRHHDSIRQIAPEINPSIIDKIIY